MPSFDVVSRVDMQEVDNAVNQVKRELENRYDFRGSKSAVTLEGEVITILADDNMKLKAMTEILNQKMTKRGISVRSLDYKPIEEASFGAIRQKVAIKQGIATDDAKALVKKIKDANLKKVQASIQGDELRVTGPKRDDLQAAIQFLKTNVTNLDLQFVNFRD